MRVALVLALIVAGAAARAGGAEVADTPECQSCDARHAAMQALQAARAAQRCAEAPTEDCATVGTTDALLPPQPSSGD